MLLALFPWLMMLGRTYAEICVGLVGILFLWRSAATRHWQWLRTPYVKVGLLAWAWLMLVVSPFALNPDKSFMLALAWIRYLLLVVAMREWLLVEERDRIKVALSLAAVLLFCALDTLWQYRTGLSLTGHVVAGPGRLTGPFVNPKVGVFMMRLLLPTIAILALIVAHRPSPRRLAALGALALVSISTIILTGERTAAMMTVLAFVLMAGLIGWRVRRLRLPALMGVSAVAIAFYGLYLTQPWVQNTVTRATEHVSNFSTTPYGEVFAAAWNTGQQHWLTGTGMQGFRIVTAELYEGAADRLTFKEKYMHPHNSYLEWFAEAGLVGLLLYIALVGSFVREGISRFRAATGAEVIAPAAMLAVCLLHFFPFVSTQSYFANWTALQVWFSVGLVFSMAAAPKAGAERMDKVVYAFLKRMMDIAGALVGLTLSLPILLWAAVKVRATMGSPVLFKQVRPGLNQQAFSILKFRTMKNAVDASGKPLSDAERLTPFGDFMRRSSIDELPQFINILKGEMSFVGPRPLLFEYFPYYTPTEMRRHEVKPGVTGWAQIHGRNNLDWDKKLSLDVWYVDHASLWLDIKIIIKTILVVLRREGVAQDGHATFLRLDDARRSA